MAVQATTNSGPAAGYFAFVVAVLLGFFLYLGWLLTAPAASDGDGDAGSPHGLAAPLAGRGADDDAAGDLALVPDRPAEAPAPSVPARPQRPAAEASPPSAREGADAPEREVAPPDPDTAEPVALAAEPEPAPVRPDNGQPATRPDSSGASGGGGAVEPSVTVEREAPRTVAYIVQPGDTLTGIARRHLGSSRRWREISKANTDTLPNPDRLRPGMRLRIPGATGGDDPAERVRSYTVRDRAESLFSLAVRFYGNPKAEALLRKANEGVLQGAEDLKPGMVIRLPETDRFRPETRRTYTVRKGDTLSEIAKRVYNDPTLWKRIAEANPGAVTDTTQLKVGAELVIPPR
ncbi:MAG: LysM peptidoglycan-binding domain-containing protein [Planctomycetota bacterium]